MEQSSQSSPSSFATETSTVAVKPMLIKLVVLLIPVDRIPVIHTSRRICPDAQLTFRAIID